MCRPYRKNYDFHGLVKVRIDSFQKAYDQYLYNEFKPCFVNSRKGNLEPDLYVRVGSRNISMLRNQGFQYYDHHFRKIFRVRYAISPIREERINIFFSGDWTVNFYPPIMGTFLQTSVIEPLIYYKVLKHGAMMMHSACLSNGIEGFIFIGSGGAGKTTTALKLVNGGLKFLGDDLTFVRRDNFAMPYPRPLHLFSYVTNGLPFLKISRKLKYILMWKDIVRCVVQKLSGEKFFIATRVPISEIYDGVQFGDPVPIRGLYLLGKGERMRALRKNRRNIELVAEKIINSGDVNFVLKENLLKIQPEERDWVCSEEKKIITSILRNIPQIYEINTRKFTADDWTKIIEEMSR